MATYSRIKHGMEITDYPELDLMESAIINSYFAEDPAQLVESEIDEIYIFGSWARGTALKGESDLDVMIFLDKVHFDPSFDIMRAEMAGRLHERVEENMPEYSKYWFSGYDVFMFSSQNKKPKIMGKMGDTRDKRVEGERRVYNLTENRYMTEEEFTG